MSKNIKTEPLQVYVPIQMKLNIERSATRIGATLSSYVRQAIVEKITRDENFFKQQAQ